MIIKYIKANHNGEMDYSFELGSRVYSYNLGAYIVNKIGKNCDYKIFPYPTSEYQNMIKWAEEMNFDKVFIVSRFIPSPLWKASCREEDLITCLGTYEQK